MKRQRRDEAVVQRDEYVDRRLLRCDDLDDLRVYSYADHCKDWDDITLNSRGIIFNRKTGEVVAHPFSKFFNLNQRQDTQERNLPWKSGFRIFKKEDGWLGILYRHANQHKIATRGSFGSLGAVWATEFLKNYDLSDLPDEVTLLFEIICPETHIVVDYKEREDLVLLAAYNRFTGEEYPYYQVVRFGELCGFNVVESYDKSWLGFCRGQLKTANGAELEGFVVRFANGLRVKMKSEDYFRRHHLLIHLTPLTIWKCMVGGRVPQDIKNQIDIEYHDILDSISTLLMQRYSKFFDQVRSQFDGIVDKTDRVLFAKFVAKMDHKAAMFAMLDGNDERLDDYIMKQIRPCRNIISS